MLIDLSDGRENLHRSPWNKGKLIGSKPPLRANNVWSKTLRSKSWDEFAKPGAPPIDFIFTVCDNAAGETCPVWPGKPMTAHWGIADPAEAEGTDAQIAVAFQDAYRMLAKRIELFIALPIEKLDQMTMQARLREIGQQEGATSPRPNVA